MFKIRFGKDAPERRSVDQLRGIEGVRVREIYKGLARQFGVEWRRRDYDPAQFEYSDTPNRCLSAVTSCLYGVTEAAVLAAGYAPAIGFLHTGKPLSFVYDVADLFKFETVVPEAFRVAAAHAKGKLDRPVEMATRHACRDAFAALISWAASSRPSRMCRAPAPRPALGARRRRATSLPRCCADRRSGNALMMVVNNAPPRLRGRLAVWLLEVRAGVYLGVYGARTREMIVEQVKSLIGEGDAVVAWDAPTDAGFTFETFGLNRRVAVDFDGLHRRFPSSAGERKNHPLVGDGLPCLKS
jgi:CRISPR-associated endoribonuclease Cas2 subtype I-E